MSNKKTHVSIGIGTVSLLLVLALLSMSLLVVLSVLSAHNDAKLTERAISIAVTDRELYARAEELRASLMGAANAQVGDAKSVDELMEWLSPMLPENAEFEDGVLTFTLMEGERALTMKLKLRIEQKDGVWRFTCAGRRLYIQSGDAETELSGDDGEIFEDDAGSEESEEIGEEEWN